jgi:hypothetical protein
MTTDKVLKFIIPATLIYLLGMCIFVAAAIQ